MTMANAFTRLFKREEARAITPADYFGDSYIESGLEISGGNQATALRLIPVYAAVQLLANAMSQLPLQQYRSQGKSSVKIPSVDLFTDPTLYGTTVEWIQRAMTSILLRGNAYGYATVLNANGSPRQIEWLHPDDVTLEDDRSYTRPVWKWRGATLDQLRFIHIPGMVLPGEIQGVSPIKAYKLTTETGLMAQQYGRDWFAHGQVPAAVLQTQGKVDQEGGERIKNMFLRSARKREPVVLGHGFEYKPISVAPEESQFIQTQKLTVNQIASVYSVPPERIGGESGSSMTYNNREQDTLDLIKFALGAYMSKFESAFSRLLPEGEFVKFNPDAFLRADTKTRYEAHQLALDSGWLCVDEIRAIEDYPPLPGGAGKVYKDLNPAPAASGFAPSAREARAIEGKTAVDEAEDSLSRFFELQGSAIDAKLDAPRGINELFDDEKWDKELADTLLTISRTVSVAAARRTLDALGLDSDVYDVAETQDWLDAHVRAVAENVNRTTKRQIEGALVEESPREAVAHVFSVAANSRARQLAQTEVTTSSAFGTQEAGTQSGLDLKKTWRVKSKRPRKSHARMNGETVPFKDEFSNGAMWPGHSSLSTEETAGCTCDLDIDPI